MKSILLGHLEAQKSAILTIYVLTDLTFQCLEIFDIFKREIPKKSDSKPLKFLKYLAVLNILK